MNKKTTGDQLVSAFADLLDELPPETPEEIDAELRAAGLDPERIGRETMVLVKKASRRAHRAQRIARFQRYVARAKWCIKQFLPLRYESRFKENDKPILCIWRMWLGRCFNVRSWELAKQPSA